MQDLKRFGARREQPPSEPTIRRMMQALDGKILRGTRDGEQAGLHRLSAVLHKEGIILAQQPVDEITNEITQVQSLIEKLDLSGVVVTADALLTQREFPTRLVQTKGADYVFTVKGNQPALLEDLQDMEFNKTPDHTTLEKAHGRLERRSIRVSGELKGYMQFPFAEKVFMVERSTEYLRSGLMATIRNLVIGILRLLGFQYIPEGVRHFAMRLELALQLPGI